MITYVYEFSAGIPYGDAVVGAQPNGRASLDGKCEHGIGALPAAVSGLYNGPAAIRRYITEI
jgi:hypothetical protein